MALTPTLVTVEEEKMGFQEALLAIVAGKRISKREWADIRRYGVLKDGFLMYHKAGESDETLHFWLVNDGDILGTDYFILE